MRSVNPLVVRFGTRAATGLAVARWSGRGLAAPLLMRELQGSVGGTSGLLEGLVRSLTDALHCALMTPPGLAMIGLVCAYVLLLRALYLAVTQELKASNHGSSPTPPDPQELRREIASVWHNRTFRALRRRLVMGGILATVISGVASVVTASYLLASLAISWPFLAWASVVLVSMGITRIETALTARWYASHAPGLLPPTPNEAANRLVAYLKLYPQEATGGSPWMFAFSGLDRTQLTMRMMELNASGGTGRVSRLAFIVFVALLYSCIPVAPLDSALSDAGFIGCTFISMHGFFGVARDNLAGSVVVTAMALVIIPFQSAGVYLQFMREWSFPLSVRLLVVRREWAFCVRMVPYTVVISFFLAGGWTLLLWLSATAALRWASPGLGMVVIGCGSAAAYFGFKLIFSTLVARLNRAT